MDHEEHGWMHSVPVDIADAPSTAWVELDNGHRVDCYLHRVGPREWIAHPVRAIALGEMRTGHVDKIPPHASVAFAVSD